MSKELLRPLPRNWWLQKPPYFQFMIRELTSLAVLAYSVLLIIALWSTGGVGSFSRFYQFLSGSVSVWSHAVVLGLALFHTGTWIALTPKVMVLWRGDEPVDPDFIAGMVTVLFVVVSGGVLWLTLA
jgi:fumarate reductase subunit C